MTIGKRIKEIRQELNWSQSKLAMHAGINQPAISDIEAGETKTIRQLASVARALGVSAYWLETGLGSRDPYVKVATEKDVPEGYTRFSVMDARVSAGTGTINLDYPEVIYQIDVLSTWAKKHITVPFSRISICTVHGDSMTPVLEENDVVFFDNTINSYRGDGIYVFTSDGDWTRVKRLQRLTGNRLAIVSENKAYETEILNSEEADNIHINGRVIAKINISTL